MMPGAPPLQSSAHAAAFHVPVQSLENVGGGTTSHAPMAPTPPMAIHSGIVEHAVAHISSSRSSPTGHAIARTNSCSVGFRTSLRRHTLVAFRRCHALPVIKERAPVVYVIRIPRRVARVDILYLCRWYKCSMGSNTGNNSLPIYPLTQSEARCPRSPLGRFVTVWQKTRR